MLGGGGGAGMQVMEVVVVSRHPYQVMEVEFQAKAEVVGAYESECIAALVLAHSPGPAVWLG